MKHNVFVYFSNYKIELIKVEDKEVKKIKEAFENQDQYQFTPKDKKSKTTLLDLGKSNCIEFEFVEEVKEVAVEEVDLK